MQTPHTNPVSCRIPNPNQLMNLMVISNLINGKKSLLKLNNNGCQVNFLVTTQYVLQTDKLTSTSCKHIQCTKTMDITSFILTFRMFTFGTVSILWWFTLTLAFTLKDMVHSQVTHHWINQNFQENLTCLGFICSVKND